ncbi:acyl-CoA thioesterase [Bradyrhizobium sp. i1.3.6]
MIGQSDAAASLKDVLNDLEPERIATDRFSGRSLNLKWGYVFGGQFVAQALSAAQQTVREDQAAHSVHGYFLQAGDERKPVTYKVERIRDGKSFATRRVDAIQDDRTVFTLTASFQREEAGLEHQDLMPPTSGPEGLLSQAQIARKYLDSQPGAAGEQLSFERAIEIRPVDPIDILNPKEKPPLCSVWYRALGTLPDRPAVHRALLAYVSVYEPILDGDAATRSDLGQSGRAVHQLGSLNLVPPPIPDGRVAPFRDGQPVDERRPWARSRAVLHAGRSPRSLSSPGRTYSQADLRPAQQDRGATLKLSST